MMSKAILVFILAAIIAPATADSDDVVIHLLNLGEGVTSDEKIKLTDPISLSIKETDRDLYSYYLGHQELDIEKTWAENDVKDGSPITLVPNTWVNIVFFNIDENTVERESTKLQSTVAQLKKKRNQENLKYIYKMSEMEANKTLIDYQIKEQDTILIKK